MKPSIQTRRTAKHPEPARSKRHMSFKPNDPVSKESKIDHRNSDLLLTESLITRQGGDSSLGTEGKGAT